jgi:DNA-binding NtrC family response regulator
MTHTVLLIDDDKNLLSGLSRALRQQPYRLLTAQSAEEAMQIIKAHPVDLIVSDECMGPMQGTQLLAWVATHYPQIVRILLSGTPSVPSALRAVNEAKVHRFFTKPCNVVELAMCIREALENKHPGCSVFQDTARETTRS